MVVNKDSMLTEEKIWLNNYPEGVPHEINPDAYQSIVDLFEQSVTNYRKKPALNNFGTTMTYDELDKRSRDFAAYLQQYLGKQKGNRLGIMLPNTMQYLVAMFGALRAGMVVVNINPLYTPRELEHQVNDAGLDTIVVLANFMHTVEEALPHTNLKHIIVTEMGDMFSGPKSCIVNFAVRRVKKMVPNYDLSTSINFREALKRGKRSTFKKVNVVGDDIAFLQYTGGTTGVAKGAMLTHRNIVSNVEQAYAWMSSHIKPGEEVTITALPLYHIFALTVNSFMFMKAGVMNVLITNPRDIPGFIKELQKHRFTVFVGVNTLFKALLRHKRFKELNFKHLKITLGGGMAVHRAVAENWKEVTGKPLLEAYGLTETAPAAACNRLDSQEFNASIGMPMPSTEIKIIDDKGQTLPIGESGELCVRGPQVMRGYWNMPEETKQVLMDDGWLRTGDVAKFDETGHLYIVDRKKDMIVVSGYNVYPTEVESVIAQHPDVLEVAVIGVPSEKTGEYIKAFIVSKSGTLTREDVIAYCRDRLTSYKIPRHVEFRDDLPKSNVGKILRKALREEEIAKMRL